MIHLHKRKIQHEKVKNGNDNKTSGYHFPIYDIDSIILSASKGFNQVFSENRKKNIEKPVAVKDAEKSHQCS